MPCWMVYHTSQMYTDIRSTYTDTDPIATGSRSPSVPRAVETAPSFSECFDQKCCVRSQQILNCNPLSSHKIFMAVNYWFLNNHHICDYFTKVKHLLQLGICDIIRSVGDKTSHFHVESVISQDLSETIVRPFPPLNCLLPLPAS